MKCNVCKVEIPLGVAYFEQGCYACVNLNDVEPEHHLIQIKIGDYVEEYSFDCVNDVWGFYPSNRETN